MTLIATGFLNAARDGNLPAVEETLERYPNVLNARDPWDMTALMWAAFRGDEPMLDALLTRGADRMCTTQNAPRDGTTWQTPDAVRGHAATAMAPKNALCLAYASVHMSAYRRLFAAASLGELGTALLVAAIDGDTDWAEELLDKGVPPDFSADAESDKTPLICAAINGNVEMVRVLLARGADPNRRYSWLGAEGRDGWPALHWAVDGGHATVVNLLLDGGARPEAADGNGVTAAMIATLKGDGGLAKLLSNRPNPDGPPASKKKKT